MPGPGAGLPGPGAGLPGRRGQLSARRWLTLCILALGTATFLSLLWSFGLLPVWSHLRGFGWGFALIIPLQICDHTFNARGWLFAFPSASAARVPFARLIMVRIAGDGVNYLTPSGNLAGEFVRPTMMGDCAGADTLVTSVVLAKAAQIWGQTLFVLLGLAWIVPQHLYAFSGHQALWTTLGMGTILGGVCLVIAVLANAPPAWTQARFPQAIQATAGLRASLRDYLSDHPGRLAAAIVCFLLGYAWGAVEIWLIARLLGLTLTPGQALAIECLSNMVDAMMFMVPAKIGTQEAGKTAIFAGLGLPPDIGFTLGLIRHAREFVWAGAGLALFAKAAR